MERRERVESPLRSRAPAAAEPTAAADARPAAEAGAAAAPRLRLRPLTGWEEEYVERHQAEPNTARLCNDVLARCLVEPGEDATEARHTVRGLLVAERDRELVALRRLSLGPDVRAEVTCPACGEVSEAEFSLDALPLDFELPPREVRVEVGAGDEAVLRLPTAGDQEDLLDAGVEGEAERRTWLLARCLERYGDRAGEFDLDFVRGLPVRTRTALEGAVEERLPALDLEMAVECSHCGAPISAPLDVPVFFFSS